MKITRTEKRYPKREPEEKIGFLGRYPLLRGYRRAFVLPLLLVLLLLLYFLLKQGWITTYGRIVARDVGISAIAVSRIQDIHVALGDSVAAGQLLVTLNKHSLNAELYRSRIALEKQKIELAGLVSRGVSPAIQSSLQNAEHFLELQNLKQRTASASYWRKVKARDSAREELAARQSLYALDGISSQNLKQSQEVMEDLQGQVNVAHALMQEQQATIKQAEDAVAQAEKKLRFAQSQLASEIELKTLEVERLEQIVADGKVVAADQDLLSPVGGLVSWVAKHAGEVVDHNDIILTVTADTPRWVEAYIYAGDWHKVQSGSRAQVRIKHAAGRWMEGCITLAYPSQRPVDEEYAVGQRVARSPGRLDENIHPVAITFPVPVPSTYPTGSVVDVKIREGAPGSLVDCQSSLSKNISDG